MNKDEWENQRKKDIKTGCYNGLSVTPVRLALSRNEIKKEIENLSELTYNEFLITNLKGVVYLNICPNTKKDLKNYLYEKNIELRKQFIKLFWEEYVYNPVDYIE